MRLVLISSRSESSRSFTLLASWSTFRSINVKLFLANMVDCLIVKDNRYLSVIQKPMGGQHRIVRLHNTSRNFGRRINFISDLRFLTIINSNPFEDESTQTRPSPASHSVVDNETLHILRIVN